ncbi:MAG: hypothetical protein AAF442_07710 [Pseudomonadota bacterium]
MDRVSYRISLSYGGMIVFYHVPVTRLCPSLPWLAMVLLGSGLRA